MKKKILNIINIFICFFIEHKIEVVICDYHNFNCSRCKKKMKYDFSLKSFKQIIDSIKPPIFNKQIEKEIVENHCDYLTKIYLKTICKWLIVIVCYFFCSLIPGLEISRIVIIGFLIPVFIISIKVLINELYVKGKYTRSYL